MRRTTGALLAAAVSLGAGTAHAAGLDVVDTFGVGGVAMTPLAPASQDRFVSVAPAPGGGTYAVGFVNVGGTDNAMAVAVLRARASRGAVRIRLTRAQRVVASGQAQASAGKAPTIVRLRGSVRAG